MQQPQIVPARWHLVVLGLILLVAGFFRFNQITATSLWMDEIWSIEMAMGRGSLHDHLPAGEIQTAQVPLTSLSKAAPWWEICTHLGGVTHPPLYFVVLRWWIDLFGTSALAVRSLSAVFSLGAIVVLFDVCRFIHGPRIGLLAAAIFSLALGALDFAQDGRAYTMLIFLALAAADALVRIEALGATRRRLWALGGAVIATALTHYLSAGFLLALGVYALIRLRGKDRRAAVAAFAVAGAVILAVWVPMFIDQKKTLPSMTPTFLREARADEHAKLTLYRVIGLPAEFLLGEERGNSMRSGLVLGLFLFCAVVPVVRLWFRRDLLLWVLWMAGTIGFVAAMDLLHQTTLVGYPRYTVLASPAIFACLAAFDFPRRPGVRDGLAIAAAGLLAIAAIQRSADGLTAKEDWRALAEGINANAAPGELLVFYNGDPWASSGTWYMGYQYYVPQADRPWLILSGRASPELMGKLAGVQSLWLVGLYPQEMGRGLLPGWRPLTYFTTSAGVACRMVRGF